MPKARIRPSPLRPGKRWAFSAITALLPVIAVLALEAGLRIPGCRPDLSLFLERRIRGENYAVMNPDVARRYFSRIEFHPATAGDFFHVPKPTRTYRIFCLGESTTAGFPYWFNGAFPAFLSIRLRHLFPDRDIEVINLGMTATNSTEVLDLASDLVGYEPDLLIVYDGHNEFYGALGAASRETGAPSRWLTRLYLHAIRWRSFALFRDIYDAIRRQFSPQDTEEPSTMMEQLARGKPIPYKSPIYRQALETFRRNLDDLRTFCREQNLPLILGTQVSNLRSRTPFLSGFAGISAGDRLAFQQMVNDGISDLLSGELSAARDEFSRALAHDSGHAEAHYLLGKALDSLGSWADARCHYVLARDYDQLRFRTSSDFNRAISEMQDTSFTVVADIERLFMAESPDSIVGANLLLEHVHPTLYGQFLIARGYAQAMRQRGLLATPEEWAARDTLPDSTLWDERNSSPIDERIATRTIRILTSAWPFSSGPPTVPPADDVDTLESIAAKVTGGLWDRKASHKAAIEYFASRGDMASLILEYRALISFPQSPQERAEAGFGLAHTYLIVGRSTQAEAELEKVIRIQPSFKPALDLLSSLRHAAEKP